MLHDERNPVSFRAFSREVLDDSRFLVTFPSVRDESVLDEVELLSLPHEPDSKLVEYFRYADRPDLFECVHVTCCNIFGNRSSASGIRTERSGASSMTRSPCRNRNNSLCLPSVILVSTSSWFL